MATSTERKDWRDVQSLHNPELHKDVIRRPGRVRKSLSFFGLSLFILWFFYGRWLLVASDDIDPRKRFIDIGSHSLDGYFDLLDVLSIQSTSGSINVGINPQPADDERPAPAELLIKSRSGQVSVDFPTLTAPERNYLVSLETRSGSIDGQILLGQITSIVSRSGGVEVYLTPYTANSSSSLHTSSRSGKHDITILRPVTEPDETDVELQNMSSFHKTRSGMLTLRYPEAWEGIIEGHSRSGKVRIHSRDVETIYQDDTHLIARKGNGSNTLYFYTRSGSVDIYF